ncbi:hypothetical protein HRI_001729400 [Hibiscus trionum]|uniref:RING-type E3 ubiquitin transferase n=1 Tax=Hibiscus trionum TaxID=183268 RepID=A0A9W7LY86_HIBTR|nr:hypothetical protein HRI_001729400 [Hibiscus trionum]
MTPPFIDIAAFLVGWVIILLVVALVSECRRKEAELNLENRRRAVVGVMQSRTNNEDIENRLSNLPVADHVVQREPPQNQLDNTSRPTKKIVRYKNGEKIEWSFFTECVICLEEFKEDDSCRVLPNCKHLYHQFCIDQWLVKNRHCPLCRGSVHNPDRTPTTSH